MMVVARVGNKITCSIPQTYCNNEQLGEILSSLLFDVSWFTGISYDELFSTSRNRDIAQARFLYCFIARKNIGMFTLQQIGDVFNINHSTVSHACLNIENALQLRDSESRKLQDRYLKILGIRSEELGVPKMPKVTTEKTCHAPEGYICNVNNDGVCELPTSCDYQNEVWRNNE